MKRWEENRFFNFATSAYRENQELFLEMIEVNPKAGLLDVGCNDGDFTEKIAKKLNTKEIFGIEIDPDKARAASERGIVVEICDASKPFPFKDCYFDIVTSNQLIEHVYNLDNFFSEVYRILKKNGEVIISTANLCSWHNIFFMILGMQPPGMHLCKVQVGNFLYGTQTHGHLRLFSLKALKDIARYHGFKVENIAVNGYYPFPRFISRLLSCLDKTHALYVTIKMRK
jgi:SAM-dependent methyltransferase